MIVTVMLVITIMVVVLMVTHVVIKNDDSNSLGDDSGVIRPC